MGHMLLRPPVLTTGPGYTGKGHETPVWCWKGKGKTEQMRGGPFACSEFPALPQLRWEHKYFAVVPAPNQLQHMAAVLVYFDRRDTSWCQHKVTRYKSIHPNAYLGSSEIITVFLRYMFKALQLINMHRLIYNPNLVLGTGKVSNVVKLKAQRQEHTTLTDGTAC